MQARSWSAMVGVAALAALLAGVNMAVAGLVGTAQLDVTQGGLYTLSPGTRGVLRALKEPVTLRLYYSPQLGGTVPVYGAYHDRVVAMLRQYAALSRGNLRLEFRDPEAYSDTEDRAIAAGLQGVPLDQSGEKVYFGLTGSNLLDDSRQIAFFKPEREAFLEYDLTRLVYDLSNPAKPVLGVMSPLPLDGDQRAMMMAMRGNGPAGAGQPWLAMLQLRQQFTVQDVALDAQVIDPKIQVLLVAQPQNLSIATEYAIDQFVMRGGRLMLMVDPASEMQGETEGAQTASDLHRLLAAWGIGYDPGLVVADPRGAWRVQAGTTDRVQAVDYLPWFNITTGISTTDPATAQVKQISVGSAGFLTKLPGSSIEFTPLLSSSAQSETIPAAQVTTDPDPARILADYHAQGGPRVIAARIHGMLHSAFAAPPPPGDTQPANTPRDPGLPPYIAQTAQPANMVVVADTDIMADRFWVRMANFMGQREATPFSDNGALLTNLAGTLAGGDALIGLSSRSESLRPFDVVDDMQHAAEARFRRTQQALQAQLDAAQQKLDALRTDGGAAITPAQRQDIDTLTRQIRDTRRQQRDVQLELRQDISALETRLRIADIVAVPALLTLLAIGLGIARRQRRARARL